jgi:hypothetical protein
MGTASVLSSVSADAAANARQEVPRWRARFGRVASAVWRGVEQFAIAGAIRDLQLLQERWAAIAPAKAQHLGVSLAEAA